MVWYAGSLVAGILRIGDEDPIFPLWFVQVSQDESCLRNFGKPLGWHPLFTRHTAGAQPTYREEWRERSIS